MTALDKLGYLVKLCNKLLHGDPFLFCWAFLKTCELPDNSQLLVRVVNYTSHFFGYLHQVFDLARKRLEFHLILTVFTELAFSILAPQIFGK